MKRCTVCLREYTDEKTYCPYDGTLLTSLTQRDRYLKQTIDNKYYIDYKIGEGGMGNVYRATHLQLETLVAIKIMHSELISDRTAIERFRREAKMAMQIRHPNAVAVMDFGNTPDGTVYLVMEYLEGCTLRERLKQCGHLTLAEANKILQQVCEAVNVAHKRKIIHRDLKPDNIFLEQLGEEENVKVLDFGIAKLKDQASSLTRQGLVIGTPHYMSPEQFYGREVDVRSDIYSIGVIVYEMLAGRPPFDAPTTLALATKQVSEPPPPIYTFQPSVPAVINTVVMHALEKDPNKRPQNVLDFAKEFEGALMAVSDLAEISGRSVIDTRRLIQETDLEDSLSGAALREKDTLQDDYSYAAESSEVFLSSPAPTQQYPEPDELVFPSCPPQEYSTPDDQVYSPSPAQQHPDPDDLSLTREEMRKRPPIWVVESSAYTYPVVCEICRIEVGRSVIPDYTIICPSCRAKMRENL
ncbi:MAG: serine/threonine-protein kinase [Acidobacteriota bacterium]|nr:serine/threonine protein kinase [Blastocatellia bacterium]MDW8411624.1 serine/threonine-protein kinase [Acidobacteriota bacterium]